jgi:UDP-glucose 4-epimerase
MSNILVTGGAGFIGSHVSEQLVDRGHRVTVLDDLSGGFVENLPDAVRFVRGSITDSGLVEDLFSRSRFDYVYHLAAYAAENLSHFIKRYNYENNVIGSVNLINASVNSGVKCFVFTSSIAVYGSRPPLPVTETSDPCPEDSYGIAKLAVEQELRISKHMFGLDHIIFRPHNVYGERQNIGDRYRNVIGIFMNQLLQGKPMTIFGDGAQTRAFTYIGDVAPFMAEAIEQPAAYNDVFNIGADAPCTVNRLASLVAAAMGAEPTVRRLPARQEVVNAFAAHDKLRAVFGSRNAHSLEDGLFTMARWVRAHGARSSQAMKNIEVAKNFPAAWLDEAAAAAR